MTISNYSTTDSSNNDTVPNGAPSGMLPSDVIDVFRRTMADQRTQWNEAQWFDYLDGTKAGVASYVGTNQFKITGADATAHYHIGRRVKIVDGGGTKYGNITAATYGAGATTVTVDISLTSPVTTVYTSVLSATNDALPREAIQDIVGAMLSGNTATNITVTYQDSDGTIDFAVPTGAVGTAGIIALYNGSDSTSTALAPTAAALKAVADAVAGAGSGDLLSTNNLSDLTNAATARGNLGLAIGSDVQAYSAVLAATTASFTTADETKLDGIEASANNYVHPTTAGNKHVPSGGAANQYLKYSADGTAVWSDPNKIALSAITSVDTTCYIPLVGNAATTSQDMFIDNAQLSYNANTGVVTSVDYTVTSDLRLKKNIEDLPVNWDRFNTYRPITHEWKKGRKGVFPGFIAQDIEVINPALVASSGEDKILSVNYAKLVPELVAHIQDLNRRIEELEARL